MKLGKSGITLEIEEFYELVELIPQVKRSIERYEREDTGIPSSPFKLDLPVPDFDTVFLPSPPSQEPIPIIGDEELLTSLPNVLHHHHRPFPMYHHHTLTLPLKIFMIIPQRKKMGKGNDQMKLAEMPTRKQRLKVKVPVKSLWGILSYHLSL